MAEPDRIVSYADEQLAAIRRYPLMWGPPVAVELTYLQLLEVLLVALRPDLDEKNPRFIKDLYDGFLLRRFPDLGAGFLTTRYPDDVEALVAALSEFESEVRQSVRPRNPYEEHDIAFRLRLRAGIARPSSTTMTSYLEVFRRILRATLKGPNRAGRSSLEVETLTDFELPSVDFTRANGAPATVTFPLAQRHDPQTKLDNEAERAVRDSIAHLTTVMEWVESSRPISDLAEEIVDPQRRQRIAVEALRLVPRGEVESVELGGRLVSRYRPVSLRATARPRLVELMGESVAPEAFSEAGRIHALDVDRASFRLHVGKQRHHCLLVEPLEDALGRWRVDSEVRVLGKRYAGVVGRPVVLVDSLVVTEPEPDEA